MPMNARLLRPRQRGGFDPRAIAGLHTWLDASVSSSVTLNSGNVSEWRDISGNGRAFTQATAGAQPEYTTAGQNGKNCLTFDGSRRLVSTATSTDWSFLHDGTTQYGLWVVCKRTGPSTVGIFFATCSSGVGSRGVFWWHDLGEVAANQMRFGIRNGQASGTFQVTTRTLSGQTGDFTRAFGVTGDPGNATAGDRATLKNNSGTESTAIAATGTAQQGAPSFTLTFGSGLSSSQQNAFAGTLCEILIYQRAGGLSVAEQNTVMDYLVAKWGL